MSLAIASTQWGYFFLFFINVNFNSPDLFFFCYMPLAVYALSIGFLASRYYSINEAYRASRSNVARVHRGSQVRYLVTNGDNILLREVADSQWDTPYIAEVATPDVSEAKAGERFDAMGGRPMPHCVFSTTIPTAPASISHISQCLCPMNRRMRRAAAAVG